MRTMMAAFGRAVLCALPLAAAFAPARATAAPAEAADVTRLQAEVDRIKGELAAQRQLILQLMQAEQQRYDVILKYLQAGGLPGDAASALPPLPSPSALSASGKGTGGAAGE